jgi:hypothetical protein
MLGRALIRAFRGIDGVHLCWSAPSVMIRRAVGSNASADGSRADANCCTKLGSDPLLWAFLTMALARGFDAPYENVVRRSRPTRLPARNRKTPRRIRKRAGDVTMRPSPLWSDGMDPALIFQDGLCYGPG